ncbi:TPA: Rha family transcriptional regulator, partial [Pseudomonas aeruginosa]
MTDLAPFGGQAATMTSREIADLVGSRHDNVRVTIERLAERGVIALPAMQEKPTAGRPTQEYVFTGDQGKRDSIIVVAQLCPEFTARLVDRWQELEQQASRPLTAAEQLLASVQLTVDLERRQRLTEQQVAALTETVGDMDRSHPLLDSIPNGMESITAIRQRIGKQYGLPPRVIDAVVRDMPHSPRPFAMVRSKHEELNAR